ncbi:hypothetical protein PIB30_023579 [Stylosanthes scabra]|uniref:Uncharacterized protein n=1 Tax=Stylosanthes scabra TaxID=79078 RepID=A0ABU6X9J1_9FABA|nr:hypothetical protein [Stylosanthes scabra]
MAASQRHDVEMRKGKSLERLRKRNARDELQQKDAYLKCYEPIIHHLNGSDLWERTDYDDIMPPPYRNPRHRPTKKKRRGSTEEEGRIQTHLPKLGQI